MQPRTLRIAFSTSLTILAALTVSTVSQAADKGFVSIFDGKTLAGWDGDPKFWSVRDGAITGQTTKDNPTKGNTFIIWQKGKPGDFELKLQYKIVNGNSGIQYRSFKLKNAADAWRIGGYQGDFEAGDRFSGILYGEQFRGILANRGQKTVIGANHKPTVVGKVGDSKAIQAKIKKEDWNDYRIVAKGFHFTHYINGVKTIECTDDDKEMRRADGLLALQLHAGPAMTVQFRDLQIKTLAGDKTSDTRSFKAGKNGIRFVAAEDDGKKGKRDRKGRVKRVRVGVGRLGGVKVDVGNGTRVRVGILEIGLDVNVKGKRKKIVLIAGRKSHGYGAHEHKAGCMLLAKALNDSGLPVKAEVVTEGWPKDPSILSDADCIVIYADGGGGHPFNAHLPELDKLMKKGIGMVCIHYGVEVPKGDSGNAFLDWTGGYFETNWSVNPHWTANYKTFPKHATTNGVKPFSVHDEWYYHMRFREKMEGVTPILTGLPPSTTLVKADGSLARPDNAHNNNPHVRKAVLERKESQHMAWARQRPDGGRGFGFTGGHDHWNWGNDQFRRLMLNAIVWSAGGKVPKGGVSSTTPTVKDLMVNQDYKPSNSFNPARIQKMLDQWNGKQSE
jgi:type 1 glutamine amidotransferase